MMKKIFTVVLLVITFIACKKDNGNTPAEPIEPFTNPEGSWAGKAKLEGIDDSVWISLTIPPDSNKNATITIFNAFITHKYLSDWQFDVNGSKLTLNLDPSRSLQAEYDLPNKRFKASYRKGNNSLGDFFLYKKEPKAIEGNFAGHYSLDRKVPPHLPYTLALNPNGTIKDNSNFIGNWTKGREKNSIEARLESSGEVSDGYFYLIDGSFDPATGILWGRWEDNQSGGGLLFLQKQ